jgi:phosphatidate cytidylyltransferase
MPWARIFSSVVAIPLSVSLFTLGGWVFTAAFGLLIFFGQLEYFQLTRAKDIAPAAKTTLVVSQVLLIVSNLRPDLADAVFPVAGALICFYLLFQPKFATIADISASIMGLFYGGYLPSYWVRLRAIGSPETANLPLGGFWPQSWAALKTLPPGLAVSLLAFSCIVSADIGAYIMGKLIGRTRLSAISPKKTVEGAIFGVGCSVAVAVAGAWYLAWPIWPIAGALIGLMIGVVSLLGDLTESMMKRDAGVKDSGQFIPGHGGILDRADSYVFTAPLVFYFFTLVLPLFSQLNL